MQRLRKLAGDGVSLLLGADLHKDSAGYTAAFNRNLLHHLNELLGAGFEPEHFEHQAFYNEQPDAWKCICAASGINASPLTANNWS
jgi:uncharacterized SAM-dependent methyltransferase